MTDAPPPVAPVAAGASPQPPSLATTGCNVVKPNEGFAAGQPVEALQGDTWSSGVIKSCNDDGSCNVSFEGCAIPFRLVTSDIRRLSVSSPGGSPRLRKDKSANSLSTAVESRSTDSVSGKSDSRRWSLSSRLSSDTEDPFDYVRGCLRDVDGVGGSIEQLKADTISSLAALETAWDLRFTRLETYKRALTFELDILTGTDTFTVNPLVDGEKKGQAEPGLMLLSRVQTPGARSLAAWLEPSPKVLCMPLRRPKKKQSKTVQEILDVLDEVHHTLEDFYYKKKLEMRELRSHVKQRQMYPTAALAAD